MLSPCQQLECCVTGDFPAFFFGQWEVEKRCEEFCRALPRSVRAEEDALSADLEADNAVRESERCRLELEKMRLRGENMPDVP